MRAVDHIRRAEAASRPEVSFDVVTLAHDERHLRRRLITLAHGDAMLVDLPAAVRLEGGDRLVLDDGRTVEIIAAEEKLYEVRGRDHVHLTQLAWHLGNRHLSVQIENEWEGLGARILILRNPAIRDMLVGLGAAVVEVMEPFQPLHGAYHGHSHAGPNALAAK